MLNKYANFNKKEVLMKWIHESSDHEIKAGDTEFDHLETVKPDDGFVPKPARNRLKT